MRKMGAWGLTDSNGRQVCTYILLVEEGHDALAQPFLQFKVVNLCLRIWTRV